MRSLLSFAAGCAVAAIAQITTAGADPASNAVDVAALKAQVALLKTEIATTKADLSIRLSNVEHQTLTLWDRTSALENAEAKLIPADKAIQVVPR